jgi:REP element-mobilizing transposase RayT
MVFHVLNRGVGRMRLFLKDADFEAFERTIEKTLESRPMRVCAYCLMSNHWHFVLWPDLVNQPQTEGELEAIRRSVRRGQPYGNEDWVGKTAQQLALESTLRARGRPRKTAS